MALWHNIKQNWQQLRQSLPSSHYLPIHHQIFELIVLYFFRRIGPGYYYQARWWRPEIPFRDKWLHMNKYEYNAFIDRWNALPYQKTSQHKVVEKAVLQLLSVPTPEFLGFLHPNAGVTPSGDSLRSFADFQQFCRQFIDQTICLKTVEGFGGSGFSAFRIGQENSELQLIHPFSGAITSLEQWWQQVETQTDGFIIERYLTQHPVVAAIHPASVNTLRIWVYQHHGKTAIAGAFLRVGRNGSLVDNTSSGGMYCPMDVNTGTLLYGANTKQPLTQLTQHPDTNAQITGVQIPFWAECQRLAGQALQAFPHVNIAGVDVALAQDGPKMIELNVKPDQIGCTRMDLPLKLLERRMLQK